MATKAYSIGQLVAAHQRTGNQIMKNGKPVYTLTESDLKKVARYVSRTPKRIAFQHAVKVQKMEATASFGKVSTMIRQRESRIEAMNRMAKH